MIVIHTMIAQIMMMMTDSQKYNTRKVSRRTIHAHYTNKEPAPMEDMERAATKNTLLHANDGAAMEKLGGDAGMEIIAMTFTLKSAKTQ